MMKIEFEALAGYEVSVSDYDNIIEPMYMATELSKEDFVKVINKERFALKSREEIIQEIKSRRCDEQGEEIWYSLMMKYLISSPHGKKHGFRGFEDMISHFRHRQQVELRIIREILAGNAAVLPARKWDIKDVLAASFSPYCLGR